LRKHCASVLVAVIFSAGYAVQVFAQFAPGVYADANHPAGPPDPQRLDQIWQVDPLTGGLYLTIPFTTMPAGGRGPRIPFALKYNSQSTVTLQADSVNYIGSGGTYPLVECNAKTDSGNGCEVVSASAPMPNGSIEILQNFEWSQGAVNGSPGPVGPWTTTGPYQYNSTSTMANQIIPGNSVVPPINYGDGCTTNGPYIYVDEGGGAHDMNVVQMTTPFDNNWVSPCTTLYNYYEPTSIGGAYGYGTQSYTVDGSAMQTSPYGVIYPDGTTASSGVLEDTNGNTATFGTDSLARTTLSTNIPLGPIGQPFGTGTYYVHTTSPTGATQSYSVVIAPVAIGAYNMAHPTPAEISTTGYCIASVTCPTNYAIFQPSASSVNAITSIGLPNGTSYTFCYDSSGQCGTSSSYGVIAKITFPTGGYVRFAYTTAESPGYGSFANISEVVVSDAWVSDGVNPEAHWTYSYSASGGNLSSTITAPDRSFTDYSGSGFKFGLINVYTDPTRPTYKETSHSTYNYGATTPMESVATSYAGPLPGQITTTRMDSSTYYQRQTRYSYDGYYNVVEKDESDWQTCTSPCSPIASPTWLRKTFTSYYYTQNPKWVTAHIVNKPYQVLVTDASGRPYSFVQYGYDETSVGGSTGYTKHDDTNYGLSSQLPRGNLTSEKHCMVLPSTTGMTLANASCSQWQPAIQHTYDLAGQPLSTKDADGNTTSFSYTDSYTYGTPPAQTDGYVTTVTNPLGYTNTYEYTYPSGQVTQSNDWNLQPTGYGYSDPGNMGRLTQTTYPDGGGVQISYDDASLPYITVTTTTGFSAGNTSKVTQYDGLGRACETQLTSDPAGADIVDTSYDGNGRVHSVSNPYRASSVSPNHCTQSAISSTTNGVVTYATYDGLSRLLTTTNQDSSTITASYAGPSSTKTDENGNQWYNWSDGLGRLTAVREPNGTTSPATMETDYTYDPLNNLTSVQQWGAAQGTSGTDGPIARSFVYNGLSWLVAARNLENASVQSPASRTCAAPAIGARWSTCYAYDSVGNLRSKTDNRGITVNYGYDTVYHLLSKTYTGDTSGTPPSCFQYGATTTGNVLGRLINSWTMPSSSSTCSATVPSSGYLTRRNISAYDAMGRIQNQTQCTPANCTSGASYASAFTYYLDGSLHTWNNGTTASPNGAVTFTNTFDTAGRLSTTTSNWTTNPTLPSTLFTAQSASSSPPCSAASAPSYSPAGALLNATLGTGVLLNRQYDTRLRTTCDSTSGLAGSAALGSSASITISGTELSK